MSLRDSNLDHEDWRLVQEALKKVSCGRRGSQRGRTTTAWRGAACSEWTTTVSAPISLTRTVSASCSALCLRLLSMTNEGRVRQSANSGSLCVGVWIANTVGLCNYKAFLLFLFYTFWACALAAAMLLSKVVHFFKGLDTVGPEKSSRHAFLF